jgi:hypothetical protein
MIQRDHEPGTPHNVRSPRRLQHKLTQVMMERDADQQLAGRVEMDDAYLGGERSGGRGRGALGKTPFIAAVETTPEGKAVCIKLRRVDGFSSSAVSVSPKGAWRQVAR